MPAALPLQTKISQASQGTTNYKILEVKYGNGYSTRAGDGFNNVQASWTVAWENISSTDFSTIVTALDGAKGSDYFTWTAPGDGSSKKWISKTVTRSTINGTTYSVSTSLEQVFDL
jgi:phage-related protein